MHIGESMPFCPVFQYKSGLKRHLQKYVFLALRKDFISWYTAFFFIFLSYFF